MPFTKETARAAGKKSKRGVTVTTRIQEATKDGAQLVSNLLKMLNSTKTSDANKIKIIELLFNRGWGKAVSHAIVEGSLAIPGSITPEVAEVIKALDTK